MLDDLGLQDRVRVVIQAGELPNRIPDQLFGGAATGRCCIVCGEATGDGLEMEFVFADDGPAGGKIYYAHPRCFSAFEREVNPVPGQPVSPHEPGGR